MMAEAERNDRAVEDEGAADAGSDAEVEHAAAFVAAERLHAGVVHDAHGTLERVGVVEVDPTVAEIPGLGDRMAMDARRRGSRSKRVRTSSRRSLRSLFQSGRRA